MRDIRVSTEVFALIWSLHEPGDESEDDILRRVLRSSSEIELPTPSDQAPAVLLDRRNKVAFPEGFEIFRTYKGREYRAKAERAGWRLIGRSELFRSLNSLNKEVVDGTENAWRGWYYTDDDGRKRLIAELRDNSRIALRSRRRSSAATSSQGASEMVWRDTVVEALKNLGGNAPLEAIYREVRRIRSAFGLTKPKSLEAIVRRELEYNSSDSLSFQGRHDLFYSVDGVGFGVWGLKQPK